MTHAIYGEGREECYVYDLWDNRIEETDRNGNQTRWKYDTYGKVLEKESPVGLKTIYTYNADHLVIREEDNEGGITCYQYDEAGNCIEEKVLITEGEWQTTQFTYDLYGRIQRMQDARGNRSYYEYENTHHHAPLYLFMTLLKKYKMLVMIQDI